MELKSLVCLFFIFLSIHMSISKPVQENPSQEGLLVHGTLSILFALSSCSSWSISFKLVCSDAGVRHVSAKSSDMTNPSLHTTDDRVKDEDEDHESFLSYVKKKSHGMGGGGSAIHHNGRNQASSLSAHSSFVFLCIISIFGLILFPMVWSSL